MSAAAAWEWRYLRAALVGVATVVVLQVGGWIVYGVVHEETTALEHTTRCLTREKLLELAPAVGDPIATTAEGGWLATRVEGNGVHLAIAGSEEEARRIMQLYRTVSGDLSGKLERRGKVVYLWEGVATPTQQQTMYDCHYD